MGYHRAGFEVVGVDIKPQPHYPFEFHQDDALAVLDDLIFDRRAEFDVVHASPPCQLFSDLAVMWNARKDHPDLIEPVRSRVIALGLPYVIENVPGAPLPGAMMLCGSMFGLGAGPYQLRRHRLFELSPSFAIAPPCQHRSPTIGIYGDHVRCRRRHGDLPMALGKQLADEAMGIDWMPWKPLCQAIPPAYTEWIGKQLMEALKIAA